MKKLYQMLAFVIIASLALTACGSGGAKASDLLGAIKQRGYILVSTDPNYAPQSSLNTNGKRPDNTKCPSDALTTAQMEGFDVDVAKAIGDALGVETCFATPGWDTITAGSWADKWDVSVGSMTITTDRQKVLDFSVPYYYTPAVVAVASNSSIKALSDLAGKPLCAGVSTTYETWINHGDLGPTVPVVDKAPDGTTAVSLPTDQECAQSIAAGRTDFVGYVTAETVVDQNIKAGIPVVKLGTPVYYEQLAAAFDKGSTLPTDTLRAEVDKLFTAMHGDNRLSDLSTKWFGADYTKSAQ